MAHPDLKGASTVKIKNKKSGSRRLFFQPAKINNWKVLGFRF
jgi:hypothetical protein